MNDTCDNEVVNATDHGPARLYCSTRCRMVTYRARRAEKESTGSADRPAHPSTAATTTPTADDPDEMLRQAAALLGAAWRAIGVRRADDQWVAHVTRANQAIDAALAHRSRYRPNP